MALVGVTMAIALQSPPWAFIGILGLPFRVCHWCPHQCQSNSSTPNGPTWPAPPTCDALAPRHSRAQSILPGRRAPRKRGLPARRSLRPPALPQVPALARPPVDRLRTRGVGRLGGPAQVVIRPGAGVTAALGGWSAAPSGAVLGGRLEFEVFSFWWHCPQTLLKGPVASAFPYRGGGWHG